MDTLDLSALVLVGAIVSTLVGRVIVVFCVGSTRGRLEPLPALALLRAGWELSR